MTVPSRGAKSRRSGRRPGWLLVTALLVLAIVASSTLVFTNRVDLLRLAVILSLWAAVMAAFASVTYRRQSELDQARARDMKFVYDLQLDREVAARREYELAVETHLRRQMAMEVRAQTADEMTALRAELASLRSNLEVMLGADLGEQPALEAERVVMAMPAPPERVESSRITPVAAEDDTLLAEETATTVFESPIIDVPEEPLVPPPPVPPPPVSQPPVSSPPVSQPPVSQPPVYRGSHRRPLDGVAASAEPAVGRRPSSTPPPPQPEAPWRPPEVRRGRHWSADGAVTARPPEPVAPEPVAAEPTVEESQGQHTGGHSVADLMSRLEVNGPVSGGGRRRRDD
ncbi:MAG: DUF6779 domain-containing protein [Mycobacterium sp.]